MQARRDAQEQLFSSLLNQARAVRVSRHMGQRLDSLDLIDRAARIRTDARLRDEALAALAHPDLKPGGRWRAMPAGFNHLHFDADYRLYARGGDQGLISIRTVADDRETQCILTQPTRTSLLRLSPDGRYVARVETDDKLRVWRVADGGEVLIEPPSHIRGLAFSRDSRWLIAGQLDAVIRFDLTTGREVNRWQLPEKALVWSIAIHPDNRRAAVGFKNEEVVSIYDAEEGKLVADLPVGPTQNAVVAWHPDGTRLAVGTSRFIQIWDVESRSKRATLVGHVQQVESLSFHPNGSLLASQSWDGILRLLDVATGRPLLEMPLLVDPEFSRDGRWLGVLRHGEDAQLLEAITAPRLPNAWRRGGALPRRRFEPRQPAARRGLWRTRRPYLESVERQGSRETRGWITPFSTRRS